MIPLHSYGKRNIELDSDHNNVTTLLKKVLYHDGSPLLFESSAKLWLFDSVEVAI